MKLGFVLCIFALLGQLGLSAALKKSQLTPALVSASKSDEDTVKLEGATSVHVVSDAAKSNAVKGYSAVLGGTIAHLALGTLYTWGNLMSYSPKSLRFYDGGEHAGQPDALIVIPLVLISQCITMPLGSLITQRIGAPNAMRIGGLLAATGVFLASYATRLLPFMVLYGMLFGFGAGIAYTAPMAAGWKWLPDKKGLVSGVILTGFGAGGFVFNIIGTKLMNPKGLNIVAGGSFPAEVYENFPKALRMLAGMYAVLAVVGSLFVTEPVAVLSPKGVKIAQSTQSPGLDIRESLTKKQFWLLWLMIVSSASAGLNVAACYKQFAATSSALTGDSYQALVGGLGALFNGIGRLFWGTISDKIGFKNSFMALTVAQSLLHFLFTKSSQSKLIFTVAVSAAYFFLAGNFALAPPAVQRLFGPRNGTFIYGLLFSAFGTASIGGLILSKALKDKFGWDGTFKVLSAMSIGATLLTTWLTPIDSLPSSSL